MWVGAGMFLQLELPVLSRSWSAEGCFPLQHLLKDEKRCVEKGLSFALSFLILLVGL